MPEMLWLKHYTWRCLTISWVESTSVSHSPPPPHTLEYWTLLDLVGLVLTHYTFVCRIFSSQQFWTVLYKLLQRKTSTVFQSKNPERGIVTVTSTLWSCVVSTQTFTVQTVGFCTWRYAQTEQMLHRVTFVQSVCTTERCEVYLHLLYVLLVQEQELYKKEDLGLSEVSFIDNQDCIGELYKSM